MPPVVAAVAAYAASQLIATLAVSALVKLALTIAVSFAVSALTSAMTKKPKGGGGGAPVDFSRDRTVTVKQPITPWRIIYGEARVGGTYTYVKSTNSNNTLNLLITVAGHEVASFREVLFDDQPLTITDAGSGRYTVGGRYSTYAGVWFGEGNSGTNETALHADLKTNSSGEWSDNHRQSGRAKLYVQLNYNVDVYPTGIPNLTTVIQGKKVYDPRTATTAWHHNPALVLADYLTQGDYGLSSDYDTEIDEDSLIAAANICEEMILVSDNGDGFTADASTNIITKLSFNSRCNTGDQVLLTTSGTLPGGLSPATSYYYIRQGRLTGKLATSYANAIAGTAIDITNAGSGNHTIQRTAEPRYTCNGAFETDEKPNEIIGRILSSMSGNLVYSGGKWKIYAGAYITPTETIDESEARRGIVVNTRISRRENFNAVKGVFVSPYDFWQPTDFPPVTNATYLSEDNGERVWKDIDLTTFTISPSMAQRLAKIELEKARQQITVTYPAKLSAYRLEPPYTVMVDNTRRGWNGKVFELVRADLVAEDDRGAPILGVDLQLRETASTVYDWNNGEETTIDPAPDSDLPDPFTVIAPGAPVVTEELYVTRDGTGVKAKAIINWAASTDGFLRDYQLEYKLSADSEYTVFPRVSDNYWELFDVEPGTYDFRVKAVNQLGVSSSYSTAAMVQIYGLSAAPDDMTGLTISAIGGIALMRWTQSTSVDVRIGGKVVFRHSSATSGATWSESVSIGDAIPGSDSVALLPLKAGTYLAKFVDSSGVASSTAATVTTKQATALAYANVSTVTEDPSFSGTHSNTVVDSGVLSIGTSGLYGTYGFAAGFDLGTLTRIRLTSDIEAVSVASADLIDSRLNNIDDWLDIDGSTGASAYTDAQVWARSTDDDPAGSPVWTDWQRLDSAEFYARGFDLEARLSTEDSAYNVNVTGLAVRADGVV